MVESASDAAVRKPSSSLFVEDFYGWTQERAALLRSGRLQVDLADIVEEIETWGRKEVSELRSRLHRSPSAFAQRDLSA